MQIDFGVPLRRGIYIPLALLACLTPATHAVAFQTGTKPAESEQADSEESAEPKTSDEATEPEEMTKSVKDQILQLQTEFETEYAKTVAAYNAAKDDDEKKAVLQSSPRPVYVSKFIDLYEANIDDQDAIKALHQALIVGGRRGSAKPARMLVQLINGQDAKAAQANCVVLMRYADPRTKAFAAQKLFRFGKEAANKAEAMRTEAIELLLPLANTPVRGMAPIQQEAVKSVWELAKAKPESTDIMALAAVGFNSFEETVTADAFNAIKEHHLDDDNLAAVLAVVPRTPTPAYEAILQDFFKNGEGDLQTQAAISLAKYIPVRDDKLDRSLLDEAELAALEQENKDLRELLGSFDGDSDLHKNAQEELFILENLSIGVKAMDIVGTDLDGKELKLSDYRGQIVFLDFWGDW